MSKEDYTDPEVEAAWEAEIERRVEEIQSGAEKGIPAAQVMKAARRALHETRPEQEPPLRWGETPSNLDFIPRNRVTARRSLALPKLN